MHQANSAVWSRGISNRALQLQRTVSAGFIGSAHARYGHRLSIDHYAHWHVTGNKKERVRVGPLLFMTIKNLES